MSIHKKFAFLAIRLMSSHALPHQALGLLNWALALNARRSLSFSLPWMLCYIMSLATHRIPRQASVAISRSLNPRPLSQRLTCCHGGVHVPGHGVAGLHCSRRGRTAPAKGTAKSSGTSS